MKFPVTLPSDADASGRRFGAEELDNLRQVLESGVLNCTRGTFVARLEEEFAKLYGGEGWFCTAVSSGTAAIHCAIAALNLEPGDEVITTSITDMGAITPILYQGAVPVFADVDSRSFNVTASTIESRIRAKTRAIIVTHLFGAPCEMEPILQLAEKHGLPVIEDAAQAPFATYQGKRVGTLGTIGCFSLQQGKHMTCGEGGLVITSDAALARRVRLFHDKAWGYGDPRPDHYFLALNYRMTELQGAVALAQLYKVEQIVRDRQASAGQFLELIKDLPGVEAQWVGPGGKAVYWKVALRLDHQTIGADVGAVGHFLKEKYGISCAPRYIQKPAFACEIFQEKCTLGASQWPLHDWSLPEAEKFRGTYTALERMLVLPWNENYTTSQVQYLYEALRAALRGQHYA